MSLPLHESRVLALIEMELCRDDPELAERFAMFNRLVARPSAAASSRRTGRTVTAVVLILVVVLGLLGVAIAA
ncbi:MAG TPA: DUF3040 domain-containing protein [Spirillospora sp.]